MMVRRVLLAIGLLLLLGLGSSARLVGPQLDKHFNTLTGDSPPPPSAQAQALHRRLSIVDLHADSLLWGRDLTVKHDYGHVDIPRLIEGNVALQAFTIVTKTPRGINYERNSDRTDNILPLALVQHWPTGTWRHLAARTLYQARRLQELADASSGRLVVIRSAAELTAYLERRARNPGITAGILGVEGAHALEGDLANLDAFYDAGIRMMSLSHFFDTDLGGSAHGDNKGGLSDKGRTLIRRMEARHVLLDLAHGSPKLIDEALAVATRPVVVSHSGVRGTCDRTRNLSDAQLEAIARNGGVVGIGYWDEAVCGTDVGAIARAIVYAVKVAGADHVALGSDFDGTIAAPFDTSDLVALTDALLAAGLPEAQIEKVMGGNALHLLQTSLP